MDSGSLRGSALEGRTSSPRAILAMLLLVYSFNFLDRQILSILAQPIKAELDLTDQQLGLLGGPAFAALYSTMAIPLALLADRTSRTWVLTLSLAAWSGFTALCGLAQNFGQLFLFRLGVGVGEAGGVAPSHALVSDHFPPERRARALAIYSLGIPLGAATGVLAGGYLAATVAWRSAFVVVGLAGLVLAPFVRMVVRDRPRPPATAPSFRAAFALLAGKPGFWLLSLGAAAGSTCGYGMAFWLPSLMQRSFDLSLVETGRFVAAMLILGGVPGILSGGALADRFGRRSRRAYPMIPAIAYAVAGPLFAAGILSDDWRIALPLLIVPQALAYVWLGPVITAVQHLVPAAFRATASAAFLLFNNLIGMGLGSWLIGRLSDDLAADYGIDALRYAMACAVSLYVVAAVLMAAATRTIVRDWVD